MVVRRKKAWPTNRYLATRYMQENKPAASSLLGLDLAFPGDEYAFQVAHEQVKGEGEQTNYNDAHDYNVTGEELCRIQHHEAEAPC